MTTTSTTTYAEARHTVNRLARAQRLATVVRNRFPELASVAPESCAGMLEVMPPPERAELAASIGMSAPSEITWAMVVQLVETGWGRVS